MSFEDCLNKAGLSRKKLVDWRESKILEDDTQSSGYLFLTKKNLTFVRKKGLLTSCRVLFTIPVDKITKIQKVLGIVVIMGNLAEENDGFFKKIFKSKGAQFKLKDADSFIKKIKEVNTNV